MNLTNLQIDIQNKLAEYNALNKILNHLKEIDSQLNEAYKKLKLYESKVQDDLNDIEKLEANSVKSLFHSVLGNKHKQIEKERQEYLESSLKFKELSKRVQILEFEKEVLHKKSKNIDALQRELEKLKGLRKNEILNSPNSKVKSKLEGVLIELEHSIFIKKEIGEALVEGENCIKLLSVVSSYLKKARDWGRWNNPNDRRGAYIKNRSIDSAIKNLSKAQVRLDMFSKELSDLGENNINFDISKSHFGQFTDFFFDNLISDWIIQQKIKGTIGNVENVIDKVRRILLALKEERTRNNELFIQLNKQYDEILTN